MTEHHSGFPVLFGASSGISFASIAQWVETNDIGWLLAALASAAAAALQWYLGAKAKIRAEEREQIRLDREAARNQEWKDFLLAWEKKNFAEAEFPRASSHLDASQGDNHHDVPTD